jgi:malate dehydrogenase (oxaloacetate-decarboxylating)(NADP+)
MAAVKALALLAKESVPEQVNIAYGEIKFLEEIILFQNHLILLISIVVQRLLKPQWSLVV